MAELSSKSTRASGKTWPRPEIAPLPARVPGVEQPIRLLNGVWRLNPRPPADFWSQVIDPASWLEVEVPRSVETYGLDIPADVEYAYRREVDIPAEFAGQRIHLRFDGVSCLARVWLNGALVRSHYGGYTSWECDVSAYVQPGQTATLALGVTHKPQEISPFQVGGMIRDVRLVARPQDYLTRLHVETDFDDAYRDAVLKVSAGAAFHAHSSARVRLTLQDPQGQAVALSADGIELSADRPEASLEIPIPQPLKWDAEHPNLYQLQAELLVEGEVVEQVSRQVGFRKIVRDGNRLLVNGQPVKLRGANRHDIYPTTGRGITPALVEQDVRLFKAANINFIRTSHYPPREDFLDVCDRYGMYVEDEIAVAFVYQSIHPTESDPQFTEAYLGQFSEMIERDRSHACVLMWSLCNESYWGSNFQQEYDYARREDSTRPLIFSYPITIPEGVQGYDIWSLHYGEWNHDPAEMTDNHSIGNAWGKDAPVLHDEYVHVACYDYAEKMRDPAVREMWGESIYRFWESILANEGALGGAIWAGIDEIMITPSGYRGWEWGIIDGWRRQKPEHWLTKKAYSPVRIADRPQANPGSGQALDVEVRNWYDHTNLREVGVRWSAGSDSGVQPGPDIAPHHSGVLSIGPRSWQDGEVLNLQFIGVDGVLVDEYNLPVGAQPPVFQGARGPAPQIVEETDSLTLAGQDFHLRFSRESGLIEEGVYQGVRVIQSGPHLNLLGIHLADWRLASFAAVQEGEEAVVRLAGSYGAVQVRFELRVDGGGLITTTYWLDSLPFHPPRARKLGVGTDVGGYREVGVAYTLPSTVDRLSWRRKGQWSAYPDDHISRNAGVAHRLRPQGAEAPGLPPAWNWAEDMRDFPLFGMYDVGGRGTKDFFSMKHGVYFASAALRGSDARVRVESDGSDAVRLEVLPHPQVLIDDRDPRVRFVGSWMPLDGEAKNYYATETISNKAGDYVEFTFQGTGVGWMAARDTFYGLAEVYIDGVKQAQETDLYYSFPISTSRGEEKNYRQAVFSVEGLAQGEHTIRVMVSGQKNPHSSNTYISVDAFVVLGDQPEGDVRLNINNLWNYPELTWGNYVKEPLQIGTGYSNSVRMRLTHTDLDE